MFNEIVKYSQANSLVNSDSMDFDTKSILIDLSLTLSGKLATDPIIYENSTAIKLKNGKDIVKKTKRNVLVPAMPKSLIAGGKYYSILYGSLELLMGQSSKKSSDYKLSYFKEKCKELADSCPINRDRLKSIVLFLEDSVEVSKVLAFCVKNKIKLTENCTFISDGIRLIDEEEIKSAWRPISEQLRTLSVASDKRVCLISGKYAEVVRIMKPIHRVRNADPKGVALISFNEMAYCSYGFKQNDNASLSIASELEFRTGFQSLVDNGVSMGDDTYLFWLKNNNIQGDFINLLKGGDSNDVKDMLLSPLSGKEVAAYLDDNIYHLISFTPNGPRLAIKTYIKCGLRDIMNNLKKWFEDASFENCPRFGIDSILRSLRTPFENIRSYSRYNAMIQNLVSCALLNRPIPATIFNMAVHRQIISNITGKNQNITRLALLKLDLIRKGNIMTESLNEESTDVPYLCGRLYAVMLKLHQRSMGVEHSFIQKMFETACCRPKHGLSYILKKIGSGHYYKKANREWGGMGTNFQKEINGLVSKIGDQGGFPKLLSRVDQSKFLIGYSQQTHEQNTKKKEKTTV